MIRIPSSIPRIVPVLLGCCTLGACVPKGTTNRRVVTGGMPAEAAPAPAEQADRDYPWPTGARNFQAKDPTGSPRVVWRVDLGTPLVHPLMTHNGVVYATGNGEVFAVDTGGKEVWRSRVNATGGIAVQPSRIAVPTSDENLLDLDLVRGTITDTHLAGGVMVGSPLPLQDELVWVTDTGQVIAESGWMVPASDSAMGNPSADDMHVYFGTRTGEVVAVSRANTRWRAVLPGPVVGGLVSADGMVFAAYTGELGRPGGVAAIAADSGTIAWRMPLTEDPAAAPALGSMLVVPDRSGDVVGLDIATGDVLWTAELSGSPSTSPAFGEFGLYVGNADGRLHRIDPDDGGEIWSIQLGATPSAAPVVVSGMVVVGLTDGSLVAVGGQ